MIRRFQIVLKGLLAASVLLASLVASLSLASCNYSLAAVPTNAPAAQATIQYPPTATPFQPILEPRLEPRPEDSIDPGVSTADTDPSQPALETPPSVEMPPTDEMPPEALPQPTAGSIPTATALAPDANPALTIWIDPLLPEDLRASLAIPAEFIQVPAPEGATLRLAAGDQRPVSQWVYALVAPFPTLVENVSLAALQSAWQGEAEDPPLLMTESTLAGFSVLWGPPAPGSVETLATGDLLAAGGLLAQAWLRRPTWAIVPFEELEPRWKVLAVDGQSPVRKDFALESYPLRVPISVEGDPVLVDLVSGLYGSSMLPASNRQAEQLTVLAMTGVTALVRATAHAMERQGVNYPARDVGDWLRGADLTHISNEVPFAEGCPFPDPFQADMRFCSDPRYIGLLEAVGTDIVELTGDHFQDWGNKAMLDTLALYQERGWLYYGGGANLEEGRQAITVEHNGNRLAFIGCNAKGGGYAQAGVDRPGAALCDFDWMAGEIARLGSEGYIPIATLQHFEYYTYRAQPDQKRDFKKLAQAGAVIVSGSQAHQPQSLEFLESSLIHYGLGNLFFDQYEVSLATRQAFIDRHVFYAGRHISTELLPILFVDYARPRPMTPEEAQDLLQTIFTASGW